MAKKQIEGQSSRKTILATGDESAVIGTYAVEDIIACSKRSGRKVKIKRYDFTRPDKFSKEQLRTIQIMSETMARVGTTGLSALLRTDCSLTVTLVDQLDMGEFFAAYDTRAVYAVINMRPIKGNALLRLENSCAIPAVSRACGSPERSIEDAPADRDANELEAGILEGIFAKLSSALAEAWKPILPLEPTIGTIDVNPQYVRVTPNTEMIILVEFEAIIAGRAGKLSLCIPFLTIEPVIPRLCAQYFYSGELSGKVSEQGREHNLSWISGSSVPTSVYYPAAKLSLANLAALKVGDQLEISALNRGEAILEAGEAPILQLKSDRGGPADSFAVTGMCDAGLPAKAEQDGAPMAAVVSQVERLGTELAHSIEEMSSRLDKLARQQTELLARQNELGDEAFFTAASDEEIARVSNQSTRYPLRFAQDLDRERLARLLATQLPQVAALALACMEGPAAGDLLARLPEEYQFEVATRIAQLEKPGDFAVQALVHSLKRFERPAGSADQVVAGGVKRLAELLSALPRKELAALRSRASEQAPEVLTAISLCQGETSGSVR